MSCFKTARQLKKEEIQKDGYILFSQFTHLMTKEQKNEVLKAAKVDGSILIFDRSTYIKKSFEFKEHEKSYYIANVICVLNALLKNYSYLKDIISFENGIAYMQDMRIYYNNQKQRAYFDVDGKQVDMMNYLRDYINSKEQSEKGNNTYDYCPNHLVSCFN